MDVVDNINKINDLDKSSRFVFVQFKQVDFSLLISKLRQFEEKYPNFAFISTDKGIFLDLLNINFQIDLKKDLYNQFILNGLVAIKDEPFNIII